MAEFDVNEDLFMGGKGFTGGGKGFTGGGKGFTHGKGFTGGDKRFIKKNGFEVSFKIIENITNPIKHLNCYCFKGLYIDGSDEKEGLLFTGLVY